MDMPVCMTKPVRSIRVPGFGGVPLVTIQDSPGMGLDIDRGTPIITPTLAMPLVDHFLVPADQVPVLLLQRTHRHECSSKGRYEGGNWAAVRFLSQDTTRASSLTRSRSLC